MRRNYREHRQETIQDWQIRYQLSLTDATRLYETPGFGKAILLPVIQYIQAQPLLNQQGLFNKNERINPSSHYRRKWIKEYQEQTQIQLSWWLLDELHRLLDVLYLDVDSEAA